MLKATLIIKELFNPDQESKYIKRLTKEVKEFYQKTIFIPAPSIIDLYDSDCVLRIADDLTMFGKEERDLRNKLIELL
jgi:hypothetical protein